MSEQTVPAYQVLPLTAIRPSKTNPRKNFDAGKLEQLAESIRQLGVVEPVLVRPLNGAGTYELVAGERRLRAARLAELESVPAIVQPMDDVTALEVQTIENLQRDDLHPLEEAAGYVALTRVAKYDVARIAARVGRSAKYVYDRLKLLQLVPKAQELFLAGHMEAGHAILLARLKPEDQKRAIELDNNGNAYRIGGLFQQQHSELPFDGSETVEDDRKALKADPYLEYKAVSVRELASWITDNVRATPDHVDSFLFPETDAILKAHEDDKLKVVLVTRGYRAGDEVRHAGKDKIFGEQSWKRADGKEKSKLCAFSRVGFVACDEGQGEAFLVCIAKDRCEIHWADRVRARKKREAAIAKGGTAGAKARDKYAEQEAREQEQRKKQEAENAARSARYGTALQEMLTALAEKIKTAPAGAKGPLAAYLIPRHDGYFEFTAAAAGTFLPPGTTAEQLVRHAVFAGLRLRAIQYGAQSNFPRVLKEFGIDYGKILNAEAPVPKVQTSARPEKKAAKKAKGKK